jgi:6-phosphofructokinase 2
MMADIVTLTFNPCVDKSVSVSKLISEKKMHCPPMRCDPGGGGINVARGLKRLGAGVVAIFPRGGYHGELLMEMLHKENVEVLPVTIKENTRENWVVLENSGNRQFRFIMPGPNLSHHEWSECLSTLQSQNDIEFIVVSGSMPPDFPKDIFNKISSIAKEKNAKLIVDTSGEALKSALLSGVYMIKPNLNELASLIVSFKLTGSSPADAARELIKKKFAEIVVVSMGKSGAILVNADCTIEIKSPIVKRAGTIGAGDSMVAGIVFALNNKQPLKQAIEYGVACGAATTMNQGTELFHPKEVENLYAAMRKETFQSL